MTSKEKTYEIEYLLKKFSSHHKEWEKSQADIIRSFKENNPGVALPSTLKDDFSLPKALEAICKAIMELRDR